MGLLPVCKRTLGPSAALLAAGYLATCVALACSAASTCRAQWLVVLCATLLYIALVDIRFRIIPHGALAVLAACGVVGALAPATSAFGAFASIAGALIGGVALAAPVLALSLMFERRGLEGLGMGDVKLLFVLGLCFGWWAGAWILALACMLAVGVQLGRAFVHRLRGGCMSVLVQTLPFGPYLAAATWVVALAAGA